MSVPTDSERACDILVVGGGPGGVAAAVAGARRGAAVVLLDEAVPGSRRAAMAGATVLAGAVAWGAFAPDEVAAVVDGQSLVFRPRRLVLAQRPHALPWPVPGWTLPGVGLLDAMPEGTGSLVVAGQGPGVLRGAVRAMEGGAVLAAVVLGGGVVTGLADRLRLARLRRANIPVFLDATPVVAEGDGRFEWLVVRTRTGEVTIEAGRCVLHGGWAAESGLARALGAEQVGLSPGVLETRVDGLFRTSVEGVFAVAGTAPSRLSRMQGGRRGMRRRVRWALRRRSGGGCRRPGCRCCRRPLPGRSTTRWWCAAARA